MINADLLSEELRFHMIQSLETLSDLLDEETERVSKAETDGLDLYFSTKRRLFEQLGILLREAHRSQSAELASPEPVPFDRPAEDEPVEASADEAVEPDEDPASPDRLRSAAARLRQSAVANARALVAAQTALTAISGHLVRVRERAQADGVYGRSGMASKRTLPGHGSVEHQL